MSFCLYELEWKQNEHFEHTSPVSSAVSAAEATSSAKPTGSTVVASLSFVDARLESVSSIAPAVLLQAHHLPCRYLRSNRQALSLRHQKFPTRTQPLQNISFNSARTTGLASRSAEAASSGIPACGSPLFVTITETDIITVTEVASKGFGAGAKVTEEPLCGQTIYKTVTNTATVTVGL